MYKIEVYRIEDNKLWLTSISNNLEYFNRYKNKNNYKVKIYKKVRSWKLIYNEYN